MASTFRAVRGNRNAKLFFSGLLLSNIGTWVQFTAIAIVVDRLTGKATAIGILTALQFAPILFLGAWGGAVADRLDRRRMAMITQTLLALQAVAIAALDFAGQPDDRCHLRADVDPGVDQRARQPGPSGIRDRAGAGTPDRVRRSR